MSLSLGFSLCAWVFLSSLFLFFSRSLFPNDRTEILRHSAHAPFVSRMSGWQNLTGTRNNELHAACKFLSTVGNSADRASGVWSSFVSFTTVSVSVTSHWSKKIDSRNGSHHDFAAAPARQSSKLLRRANCALRYASPLS